MPIIFSFSFLFIAVSGAAFGTGAFKLFGSESVAVIVGGVIAVVIDLMMRRGSNSNHPLIDPELGGHLYFIPAWIFGSVATLAGCGLLLGLY